MFLTESWFWRGTQSAIFYYVSCSPWVEYQHKRHRRQEAARSEKEKADIITKQPDLVMQPGPFQTNAQWAEEILTGPGPPVGPLKRWRKEHEKLVKDLLKGYTEDEAEDVKKRAELRSQELGSLYKTPSVGQNYSGATTTIPVLKSAREIPTLTVSTSAPVITGMSTSGIRPARSEPMSPISEVMSAATEDSSSSEEADPTSRARPSMERRLSSAVENIKDTIKGWNWKRYEREDEILSGFQERLRGMWDKATNYGADGTTEGRRTGRRRAGTSESEKYDWERTLRNPEINELHPPTVSKLPATRAEAAWMKLPPPSRAVMEGMVRPQDETMQRWPLAVIGRSPDERAELRRFRENVSVKEVARKQSTKSIDSNSSGSWRTPDLSNSSSDEDNWSEQGDDESHLRDSKRHSAPEGWSTLR